MKTKFYQYIYDKLLLSEKKGLVSRVIHIIFRLIERWILAKRSPLVHFNLKNNRIILPWTHNLPSTLRDIPHYSHNTARIGRYVKSILILPLLISVQI